MKSRRSAAPGWFALASIATACLVGACNFDQPIINFCNQNPSQCYCPENATDFNTCCALNGGTCRLDLPEGKTDCCDKRGCVDIGKGDGTGICPQ